MPTLKRSSGLPSRPSEGHQRRLAKATSSSGTSIPRPAMTSWTPERAVELTPKTSPLTSAKPKPLSRVPKALPLNQQSWKRQSSSSKPATFQNSEALSTSSVSTSTSSTTTHAQTGSGSSTTSSQSYDNSYYIMESSHSNRRQRLSIPRLSTGTQGDSDCPNSGSGSAIPRSSILIEPKLSTSMQLGGDITHSSTSIDTPMIYPELDRYRDHEHQKRARVGPNTQVLHKLSTQDLPPPTPGSVMFSASSTQLSASPMSNCFWSPGPGPYSRDTTPTSICSQSPILTTATRHCIKNRQLSPAQTRPPITRRRTGSIADESNAIDPYGLAAVRESLNSTSSGSTVKEDRTKEDKKSTRGLSIPPPNPPPRKSSQQFHNHNAGNVEIRSPPNMLSKEAPFVTSPLSPRKPVIDSSTKIVTRLKAPRRPSREGVSGIQPVLLSPAPVIRSNLSSASVSGLAGQQIATKTLKSQVISRGVREGPSNIPTAGSSPSRKGSHARELSYASSSLQSNPIMASSFKLPFFGRKKSASQMTQEGENKPITVRKGPVAGTGHEGYGRRGAVRRCSGSSNLARGMSDTQSSQESLLSDDSFFAERINPVIIAGGSVVENRNTISDVKRTDSSNSLASGVWSPSTGTDTDAESRLVMKRRLDLRKESRTTMWPSVDPEMLHVSSNSSSRRPSESSDSEHGTTTMKPTLAFRRSAQRPRPPDSPMRLPKPINTRMAAPSPMTSIDTSITSDDSFLEIQRDTFRGRDCDTGKGSTKKPTKLTKSPRKWNFFGRSNKLRGTEKDDKIAATVQIEPAARKSVAFYTIIDQYEPESEEGESVAIQEVLRNADVYSDFSRQLIPKPLSLGTRKGTIDYEVQKGNSPHDYESTPPCDNGPPSLRFHGFMGKPSPPPTASLPPLPASASIQGSKVPRRPSRLQRVGRIPKATTTSTHQLDHHHLSLKSFSRPFNASNPHCPETSASSRIGQDGLEFLKFSPRKMISTSSRSSSSSGTCSLTASASPVIIPKPGDIPSEDEIWDEYNDILSDEYKPPPSATSSKGKPFHLESKISMAVKDKTLESPTILPDSRKTSTYSIALTDSSHCSLDMMERLQAAFQPHSSPTTSLFTSDEQCHSPDSEENSGSGTEIGRQLSPIPERDSTSSCGSCNNDNSLAQLNLRARSMTVSKWLTFGHVLFSDVRYGLDAKQSLTKHSILVIDGLGNDDWSFYAAEIYPTAMFFNLSPRAPLGELPGSPCRLPSSPPNHRQIQYQSHLDNFPFESHSFAAVVYRFPVAAPESHTRNILKEARRVLKPGGYLELSILDVDLNNMGTHGRRAVRRLKERIHERTPETNLASTADLMVRQIGKAGFSNIKTARVGVPISLSTTDTTSKSHHRVSTRSVKGLSSLSALMSDDSTAGDEQITKMVARVGRWWYTRCYESAAAPIPQGSIWNDKLVMRECERLGTSLKMMVCCGRAPEHAM